MKVLFYIFLSLYPASLLLGQQASSLYQLSVPLRDSGRSVNMVACQGKKVLIAVCDAREPDMPLLAQLNDLQQKYKDRLEVIVIPVNDLTPSSKAVDVNRWQGIPGSYQISRLSAGKKASGKAQHPLLRWVTNQSENRHFDHDIKEGGYLFVISETGRLFAVLKASMTINESVMGNILAMQVPDN
jgi:glutathione peroxidase-family protein